MNRYEFSVIYPVPRETAVANVMHVFELVTQADLETMRKHADDLAGQVGYAGRYTALNMVAL